jgi:predicted kinase
MTLTIPNLSLVVLVGVSGSGKSTFARRHFLPTEILSSDACRGLVSDNENDQAATKEAFEVLHFIAAKRLAAGRLTVVDATNVQPEARKPLVALAREFHVLPVAIVLDVPERVAHERNRGRADRDFGPHVSPAAGGPIEEGAARPASAKASGGCMCCATKRKSRRRKSCAKSCGTIGETITGRSTSSAICMGVLMNCASYS